jgi:hypothetical protein
MTISEDLEQQLRPGRRQRNIAQLVDNQQLVAGQLLLKAQKPLLIPGLQEFVHQGRCRREAHRQALLAGR